MRRRRSTHGGNEEHSPCPHFPACGGCYYQGLTEESVLSIKETAVREILGEEVPFDGILKSPLSYGYRNKMEFSFGDDVKDGPLTLGMHARGSFFNVVSVPECMIVDEDYRRVIRAALSYFGPLYEAGRVRYFHRKRQEGYLRHLLVRKGYHTGEIMVDLVTTSVNGAEEGGEATLLEGFVGTLREIAFDGVLTSVLHTVNDSVSDAVKDGGTSVLYGQDFITDEILGLSFKITPFSFFQTNTASAQVLYGIVRGYVRDALSASGREGAGVLYDLYSGTGTIAQLMADVADRVYGVEIVEEAVEAARENALANGLTNCEFIAGDVLEVLGESAGTGTLTHFSQHSEQPQSLKKNESMYPSPMTHPDFIILDPPRDGVHPKALSRIAGYGVPAIVYVSCKPASLLKDLPVLYEAGYRVTRSCCLDQFPWTKNIEAVLLLEK